MATRTAVSVLLTRDPASTEVYLVERNPKLKFFGGYFAFAGGTLDDADREVVLQNATRFPEEVRPFVVAAAREIFEETGVLLTSGASDLSSPILADYRKKLLNGELPFAEILRREGHSVDAGSFHWICKIITPEFSPVRYETHFLWARIPTGQAAEIWEGELVSGQFISAGDALARWKQGEMLIVPPVIVMLQELSDRSVETFTDRVAEIAESYLRGELHRVYFTPGIHMVTLKTGTLPPATHTNAYLVGESDIYIIDPAPSDRAEQVKLWNYLEALLKEGRTLKGVLLTHHHSDHIGAVSECLARYGLPLMAHEKTAAKLSGFVFSRLLKDGDELALGASPDGEPDWKLKVFHTPGHASGHLAFQESRYGAVIAADLISTVSTIVISPPDGHLATYMSSLEVLASITNGTLYPSHGPAVLDGKRVVHYYIEHRQERENKLLGALSKEPRTPSDLVKQVYDDVDSAIWPLAEHSLRSGLIKLAEEGKCLEVSSGYVLSVE